MKAREERLLAEIARLTAECNRLTAELARRPLTIPTYVPVVPRPTWPYQGPYYTTHQGPNTATGRLGPINKAN